MGPAAVSRDLDHTGACARGLDFSQRHDRLEYEEHVEKATKTLVAAGATNRVVGMAQTGTSGSVLVVSPCNW